MIQLLQRRREGHSSLNEHLPTHKEEALVSGALLCVLQHTELINDSTAKNMHHTHMCAHTRTHTHTCVHANTVTQPDTQT